VAFEVESLALCRMLGQLLLLEPLALEPGGRAPLVIDTLTITSGSDGAHKPGSKHYIGEAIDVRTRDWSDETRAVMRDYVAAALGPKFRVIDEVDHLHVQVIREGQYP
jgi:hypothetical protein